MNSYSMTSTLLKMKLTKVTSMVPSTVHQTSPHSIRVTRTPRPIRARFTLVTQAMSFSLPDLPYAYDALEVRQILGLEAGLYVIRYRTGLLAGIRWVSVFAGRMPAGTSSPSRSSLFRSPLWTPRL